MPDLRPTVIYVAGAGRSGSTLLEGLLAQRLGAAAVGEIAYVWQRGFERNERCSCGEHFLGCPFWTEVLKHAFAGGEVPVADLAASQAAVYRMRNVPALRRRRLRSPELQGHLDRVADAYARIHRAVATVSGTDVVIDSSKFAAHGYALAERSDLDLKVVHLVRDSRAVAYSWQRTVRRPEAVEEDLFMATFDARTSATIWLQDNLFCGGLRRSADGVLLRYEDLMAAPDLVDDLVTTLGLTPPPAGALREPHRHSVSGNPSRMTGEPRPLLVDLAWTSKMPTRDRRTVTALTAPALLRYRYALRSPSGAGQVR